MEISGNPLSFIFVGRIFICYLFVLV